MQKVTVANRSFTTVELEVPGGGWTADEVTVSQDMMTIGLSVNVNPGLGVDQLRVLVRSKD